MPCGPGCGVHPMVLQAEVVAGFTPLGSFGCLGAVLTWRAGLPAGALPQLVADLLGSVAAQQSSLLLSQLRSLVRPTSSAAAGDMRKQPGELERSVTCRPAASMLCLLKLAVLQAASVEHYEGRTSVGMSEAVKSQHALPFISGIVSFAARLEALVPGEPCSAGLLNGTSAPLPASHNLCAAEVGMMTVGDRRSDDILDDPDLDMDNDSEEHGSPAQLSASSRCFESYCNAESCSCSWDATHVVCCTAPSSGRPCLPCSQGCGSPQGACLWRPGCFIQPHQRLTLCSMTGGQAAAGLTVLRSASALRQDLCSCPAQPA